MQFDSEEDAQKVGNYWGKKVWSKNSSIGAFNLNNVTNVCKIHPTKSQGIGKKRMWVLSILPLHFQHASLLIYHAVSMMFSCQNISVTSFRGPPLQWMVDSRCTEKWRGEMRERCLLAILSEPSEQIITDLILSRILPYPIRGKGC